MTKIYCLDLKLDADNKKLFSRVASENARALLDKNLRITFSQRDFLAFRSVISAGLKPNPALHKALASAAYRNRA